MYNNLVYKISSSKQLIRKKLGYGGFVVFFLIAFSFFTVFKPYYLHHLQFLNLQMSIGLSQALKILNGTSSSFMLSNEVILNDSMVITKNRNISKQVQSDVEFRIKKDKNLPIFTNRSNSQQLLLKDSSVECRMLKRSDFCKIKGDIRIDENSSTIFIVSSESDVNKSWRIRPYARKGDESAMNHVREWSLKLLNHYKNAPKCTLNHSNTPAILFSSGGYSGNHFHAFTDIFAPLYSTSRPYNGTVEFLVTDNKPWWVSKFKTLLKSLSKYEILDIDKKDNHVHCFTSLTLGLQRYSSKELTIENEGEDPSSTGISMKDFRQLLRDAYSLKKVTAIKIKNGEEEEIKKRPRIVIISRKRTRAFSNIDEIAGMAKGLGFEVVVHEPDGNVSRTAEIMNSCDVVLGVHGAGLTNIVFVPENGILIQVIPFGGAEWVSKFSFEEPSKGMNLRYLGYKISLEESSLIQQYPSDHVVLRNPSVIHKQGWMAFKSIYFNKQNVKLDLNRFRPTLLKALELLHH